LVGHCDEELAAQKPVLYGVLKRSLASPHASAWVYRSRPSSPPAVALQLGNLPLEIGRAELLARPYFCLGKRGHRRR